MKLTLTPVIEAMAKISLPYDLLGVSTAVRCKVIGEMTLILSRKQ